jgi:acyl-CoA synthetase (AMP-forming)/AMP-acid ligase II
VAKGGRGPALHPRSRNGSSGSGGTGGVPGGDGKGLCTLKEGGEVSEEELISYCKERMANYKYTRQVEFLEELPKTPTGKFLGRELREGAQAEA